MAHGDVPAILLTLLSRAAMRGKRSDCRPANFSMFATEDLDCKSSAKVVLGVIPGDLRSLSASTRTSAMSLGMTLRQRKSIFFHICGASCCREVT